VIKQFKGSVGEDNRLVLRELRRAKITLHERHVPGDSEYEHCKSKVQQRYIALAFLMQANQQKYGKLLKDLANTFTMGNDKYPADMTGAYNLLVNYKVSNPQRPQ
jgi:hypothetical protein